jgi:protein involved in polysaccharide export with SLBB domain
LALALNGDPKDNVELEPKDRVFIHKNLARTDPPIVTVEGEVERPGKYPLGENMTAATLVRVAGGLKRGAYTQEADLTRYELADGSKIASEHVNVPIALALKDEPDADVRLRDGDVLTIRQVTGWKDLGATIKVDGEVMHPGTYGIQEGERLSSIIQRAGGLRKDAYPYGAVFQRQQIREIEEKNRADLIDRVQSEAGDIKGIPEQSQEDIFAKQAAVQQFQTTLQRLQDSVPEGRLVIHISQKIKRWEGTASDVQVRTGDSIFIPKRPGVVLVDGSVYNPTGVTYKPGKNAGWYLKQAGGATQTANKKSIFVIRADGSVAGGSAGLLGGGVESSSMQPGDMIVVPEKIFTISRAWQNTAIAAQIATAIALSVEAARTF